MNCRRLLLADRHFGVLEGSQCLLRDLFDSIVMVADEQSLIEVRAVKKLRHTQVSNRNRILVELERSTWTRFKWVTLV